MRLTKPNLARATLPPGKAEARIFDESLPGFGVRIRAGGKRTWIVQYRSPAGSRTFTIGNVEVIEPEDARKRAKEVLAKAQLGFDAQAEKAEARAKASIILGSTIEGYLNGYAAKRVGAKHLADTTRYLKIAWKPLHGLRVDSIDRRAVAARLGEISAERGPIAGNRARVALSAFYAWALREGLADTNPVQGTNRSAPEISRDRVLSEAELASVWAACGEDDYGRAVKLLVLTGQRRGEVEGMLWSEIDVKRRLWTMSGERTKNGRPHEVPLSDPVLAILDGLAARAARGDPGRDLALGEGQGGFSGWSKSKKALDDRITAARKKAGHAPPELPEWRHHDLRRSLATGMGEIGVQPHVVEAVLNHVSGTRAGIAGVYNRALYRAEKQAALERWAEHVLALVEGCRPKVVPLRSREA